MYRAPAPPLALVDGQRDIALVAGLGGRGGAMLWRAACCGCGAIVACTPGHPQPECTGCGRARHGIIDTPPRPRGAPYPRAHSALGPYRVLVTGSRAWDDVATLYRELDALYARYGARLVIVHGDCKDGADAIADAWAAAREVGCEPWPASWPKEGRAAGPRRNAAMVASRPDEVLAFIRDSSKGATGCAMAADRAGLPVRRFIYGTPSISPSPNPSISPSTILRPAAPIELTDPALPGPVRKLAELAATEGWPVELTAALAAGEGGPVASVAVRVRGLGYATYRRRAEGWEFFRAAVAAPYLKPANVGQFTAALLRRPYTPPAPRPPAPKVPCPGCGAEVSLTAAGKIYASHKCATKTTEGRS